MPYVSPTKLANYLKRERKRKGLGMREAANRSGLNRGFLSRLEAGTYQNIGIDTLRKIAQGYGVPFETLLIEAGYVEGEAPEIPDLRTYLRTHEGLTEKAAEEVEGFVDYARKKYEKSSRSK